MEINAYLEDRANYWRPRLNKSNSDLCYRLLTEGIGAKYPDAPPHETVARVFTILGFPTPPKAIRWDEVKQPERKPKAKVTRDPTKPPAPRKLNFRLINDPSLDLNSRIVYSYLWKWAWLSSKARKKRKPPTPPTYRRLRRATGFRHSTIVKAVETLQSKRYIDASRQPFTKDNRIIKDKEGKACFRKLKFTGDNLRAEIVNAFMGHDDPVKHSAYYTHCLGISRAMFFRVRVSSVTTAVTDETVTDETGVVTDETPEWERMRLKVATDETVSNT